MNENESENGSSRLWIFIKHPLCRNLFSFASFFGLSKLIYWSRCAKILEGSIKGRGFKLEQSESQDPNKDLGRRN